MTEESATRYGTPFSTTPEAQRDFEEVAYRQMREQRILADQNFDGLVALLVGMARSERGAEAGAVGNEILRRHEATAQMALLGDVRRAR